MKKLILASLIALLLGNLAQARKVTCEDLEYRLGLTRTDIELLTRVRHESANKDALLRELQDHERYLQNEIRAFNCF